MKPLDIKLWRDLGRLWAQALAIALVVAGGSVSLIVSVGSLRSLEETRATYYDRNYFADVFASVSRAPKSLASGIADIPGVGIVDTRIARLALLDIADLVEPATGLFVSLPESGEPELNRPYMRLGRMPDSGSTQEALISEGFALAHGFVPGSRFSAVLNGIKRDLTVVGVALSPEFIYAIGPGDRMPDNRRFGVIWMPERALAAAFNLQDAFSSVSLRLQNRASEQAVIDRLDDLLDPYGGSAAYSRRDQTSHAFIEHGLDMLRSLASTLPPIFVLVVMFLVNLTLTRLVTLEREQIGLLKALGYRTSSVALHYLKFVGVIAAVGTILGSVAGSFLGVYVTRLFGEYYSFPFLVFDTSPDVYVMAAGLNLAAAVAGAYRSVRRVVQLPPAVAMQPPAPPRFKRVMPDWAALDRVFSQPVMMMLRSMVHHPVQAALTILGLSAATGILVVSLFVWNAIDQLVEVTYFLADRQDATISFTDKQSQDIVFDIARLPGVLAAEPGRSVPARIRNGAIERRITISGRARAADLSRIIDVNLRPVTLPEEGLAISAYLGGILGVSVGDTVEVDLLEGQRRTVELPISALIEDYFGISGMMDAAALARLMREAPAANSVDVTLDDRLLDQLYAAIKGLPIVAGTALQSVALANFRRSLAVTLTTMAGIYTSLAAIIAFGIVYNSARVALSERARELASLRVLGFTRGETMRILLLELTVITLLAQLPGWLIGFGLSWLMKERLAGELMRVPMVIENLTFAVASAIILAAALFSALVVARRVGGLDLVAVLKTRE